MFGVPAAATSFLSLTVLQPGETLDLDDVAAVGASRGQATDLGDAKKMWLRWRGEPHE